MTYDRSLGSIQFYVNGNQVCNIDFSGDILDTDGEPAYVGYNPSGGNEYSPGMIDELFVFSQALTSDQISALYQGRFVVIAPWLSVEPSSSTLPGGSTLSAILTFDTTNLTIGTYTTTLLLASNDPLLPITTIPVKMSVIAARDSSLSTNPGEGVNWVPAEIVGVIPLISTFSSTRKIV
jgi:hypothetical protein